jgi:multimeric flavodoxin WrbA
MKVIGIIGSQRKNGNTEILTGHTLKAVSEEGIDTEIITLCGLNIQPCTGCQACYTGECPIDDDVFKIIYPKMVEADGIILSTPVYFGSATALIKALMERTGFYSRRHGEPFKKKIGGPLVVARRGGHLFTASQMTNWFQILGFVIPGATYWNIAFGRDAGEVTKDEEGMRTAWEFGKNIAWAAKKLRA